MSKGAKIFAFVSAASLLFGILLVILGKQLWTSNSDRVVEKIKKVIEEGRAFAEHSDDRGCVDEGFARMDRCGALEITCGARVPMFVRACLDVAAPTTGFCDDVPKAGSLVDSATFQWEQCSRRGRAGSDGCRAVLSAVQAFCTELHKSDP